MYEELLNKAYSAYRVSWCLARQYSIADMDEEVGINGECYVSLDEFADNEFRDADIVKTLLPPSEFDIWKEFMTFSDALTNVFAEQAMQHIVCASSDSSTPKYYIGAVATDGAPLFIETDSAFPMGWTTRRHKARLDTAESLEILWKSYITEELISQIVPGSAYIFRSDTYESYKDPLPDLDNIWYEVTVIEDNGNYTHSRDCTKRNLEKVIANYQSKANIDKIIRKLIGGPL